MKFKLNILWNMLWWIVFAGAVICLLFTIPTWERWKWGYFSIDAIPYFLILLFLYFINNFRWIKGLQTRISKLEAERRKE